MMKTTMNKNSKKSIILLSGGLDSLVCLGVFKEQYNIDFALFFDYGQRSYKKELEAVKKICKHYKVKLKKINLPWLKNLSGTSVLTQKLKEIMADDNVWIPNRNGLFLNIAGSYAEELNYTNIIIGANSEEAKEFPDNSKDFINAINKGFQHSTKKDISVIAPLVDCDKNEIVRLAIENNVPLEYVWSCYTDKNHHCGICKSCVGLKNALEYNKNSYYLELLFKNADEIH
ncbi:7-cyano-7-deazaguanine synthase QueC [bacterium]|nr:7-cyano-7-deazaguanine synthase QueC [bacterium]